MKHNLFYFIFLPLFASEFDKFEKIPCVTLNQFDISTSLGLCSPSNA